MASKGQAKPSLSDLSKRVIYDGNLRRFYEELKSDNDRACALVGTAGIDNALTKALTAKFIPLSKEEEERLFNSTNAPLSTLSGKILIAYALGVIDNQDAKDLTTIRHVRNAFAHSSLEVAFADGGIVEKECNTLSAFKRINEVVGFYPKDIDCDTRDPRKLFTQSVWYFLIKIDMSTIRSLDAKNIMYIMRLFKLRCRLFLRIIIYNIKFVLSKFSF
jgi:hypothetical protein